MRASGVLGSTTLAKAIPASVRGSALSTRMATLPRYAPISLSGRACVSSLRQRSRRNVMREVARKLTATLRYTQTDIAVPTKGVTREVGLDSPTIITIDIPSKSTKMSIHDSEN